MFRALGLKLAFVEKGMAGFLPDIEAKEAADRNLVFPLCTFGRSKNGRRTSTGSP